MELALYNQLERARDIIYEAFDWYEKADKHQIEYERASWKKIPEWAYLLAASLWVFIMFYVFGFITQVLFRYPKYLIAAILAVITAIVPCSIMKRFLDGSIRKKQE